MGAWIWGGAGCPASSRATLPAVEDGVPRGRIDGRDFEAASVSAGVNARGDLVISMADFALECDVIAPPDDVLASLPRKVLVLVEEARVQPGVLRIEFPDVQEAQANVNLYDADGDARSVVIRRGEIAIDAVVTVAGSFDVALCPAP